MAHPSSIKLTLAPSHRQLLPPTLEPQRLANFASLASQHATCPAPLDSIHFNESPMERPYILHMFTPGRQMSPFDINMAADAGYQIIVPYCEVGPEAVAGLTQDTIFSRGPKGVARTGIFIGGRDATVAADMVEKAKAAMVKPFVVSVMADPSGAFTTAAAMVACVEAALKRHHQRDLSGQRVLVLGGTGPVGRIAGVIAAQAGAQVHLSSRHGTDVAEEAAQESGKRFGVTLHGISAGDRDALRRSLAGADVVLACAAAGVQVVSADDLAHAKDVRVLADVNAVPPEGIAGVGVMDDAKPVAGTLAVGIGALAIGNVKYQTQHRLLVQMRSAEKAQVLSFPEAFAVARAFLAEPKS
jgi:methylene-tetrahydromethanopterin dehydrogenase